MEGILQRTITALSQDQNRRRQCCPESARKIDEFIRRVERLISLQEKFTLVRLAFSSAFVFPLISFGKKMDILKNEGKVMKKESTSSL